ncbi:Transketolase central region, partial [mine drainage metagenome]
MTVVVPADAPTTRTATRVLHDTRGPAYLRLPRENLPVVTDGEFRLGRAPELAAGSDLTIGAVGVMVARALEVARRLGEGGISVRVLDLASVKPFDEPAILRAARETGAILVLEEHSVLTGVGAL